MSRGFSRVVLVGNLGRDPEMRYSQNGTPVTTFSLAVNRRRRDQEGQYQDETSWFRVTLFRFQAENANEWLRKGNKVLVEGQIQIRQYTGNDGVERTSVDVLADSFLNLTGRDEAMAEGAGSYGGQNRDTRGPGGAPQGGGTPQGGRQQQGQQQQKNPFDDYDDDIDDVPF